MKTYISLLRGINVSGQKIIKMEALRKMYESAGFCLVRSYLQSGNVVFQSPKDNNIVLGERISALIMQTFGFDVFVHVLAPEELKDIIHCNTFNYDSTSALKNCYVTYLERLPEVYDQDSITSKKQANEEIFFTDKAVYLYCPKGYGTSKLSNNLIEAKLKVRATTRNWKTSLELMKIANNDE